MEPVTDEQIIRRQGNIIVAEPAEFPEPELVKAVLSWLPIKSRINETYQTQNGLCVIYPGATNEDAPIAIDGYGVEVIGHFLETSTGLNSTELQLIRRDEVKIRIIPEHVVNLERRNIRSSGGSYISNVIDSGYAEIRLKSRTQNKYLDNNCIFIAIGGRGYEAEKYAVKINNGNGVINCSSALCLTLPDTRVLWIEFPDLIGVSRTLSTALYGDVREGLLLHSIKNNDNNNWDYYYPEINIQSNQYPELTHLAIKTVVKSKLPGGIDYTG